MKLFRILGLTLAMSLTALAQNPSAAPEKLSKTEIRSLVATAATPTEHMRLAGYFSAESRRYAAEAQEHMELEAQYKKNPMMNNTKRSQGTVDHCDYIAKSLKEASAKSAELAKMHEAMATDSERK